MLHIYEMHISVLSGYFWKDMSRCLAVIISTILCILSNTSII